MLRRTHSEVSPWYVVHTDMKPLARIAILRHLLKVLAPPEIADKIPAPDPGVLYRFEPAAITDGRLEH